MSIIKLVVCFFLAEITGVRKEYTHVSVLQENVSQYIALTVISLPLYRISK